MIHFARAFIKALRLTLRGDSVIAPHFQPLQSWIKAGLTKLAQAEAAAQQERVDPALLQLKLDGRPTSLAITLQMLRHNLTEAYPRLIRLNDPHSMTVVQSSNMNDQYRVAQFAARGGHSSAKLQRALDDLNRHLQRLPAIEAPQSDA